MINFANRTIADLEIETQRWRAFFQQYNIFLFINRCSRVDIHRIVKDFSTCWLRLLDVYTSITIIRQQIMKNSLNEKNSHEQYRESFFQLLVIIEQSFDLLHWIVIDLIKWDHVYLQVWMNWVFEIDDKKKRKMIQQKCLMIEKRCREKAKIEKIK